MKRVQILFGLVTLAIGTSACDPSSNNTTSANSPGTGSNTPTMDECVALNQRTQQSPELFLHDSNGVQYTFIGLQVSNGIAGSVLNGTYALGDCIVVINAGVFASATWQ